MKQRDGNVSSTSAAAVSKEVSLPPLFIGQSSGRTILLRELQSRLETLEKVEEWDVSNNKKVDEREIEMKRSGLLDQRQRIKGQQDSSSSSISKAKSSAFFLGASGSLLSELKGALSNTNTGNALCTNEIE